MISKRSFAIAGAATVLAGWALYRGSANAGSKSASDMVIKTAGSSSGDGKTFEIVKTDAEWRKQLTPLQYKVLRKHGTERPYTSPLDKIYSDGVYKCAGCDLALFSSKAKYDSRTGWPSFWKPIENAVGTSVDYWIGYPRVEVHCRRCGGHLGHVFKDGPPPTGLRYCMNGVAMTFAPGKAPA